MAGVGHLNDPYSHSRYYVVLAYTEDRLKENFLNLAVHQTIPDAILEQEQKWGTEGKMPKGQALIISLGNLHRYSF
jgi:hypothetical protein